MRRKHQHAPAEYSDYDLRNLLICPEGVIVAVDDRPGRLAMVRVTSGKQLREGDFLRDQGERYRVEEFVCSMGFHRDSIHVYRIRQVD